jgi:thermitase
MSALPFLAPVLTIVAVLALAARRGKQRGSARRGSGGAPWPWLFILAAVGIRVALSPGAYLAIGLLTARDVGIGLLLGGVWLAMMRVPRRAWLTSGLVLLGAGFVGPRVLGLSGPMVELLVELGPDDRVEEVAGILESHGATWTKAFENVTLDEDADLAQFLLVRCPAGEVDALLGALRGDAENVDTAEPNADVPAVPILPGQSAGSAVAGLPVNDPQAAEQWSLSLTHADVALQQLAKVRPERVAIVAIADTGVDGVHEDLSAVFGKSPGDRDVQGHGTHCAGIAGAATNNGVGIASLNYEGRFVRILGFPALSDTGNGTVESVAQAIIDAADAGADVISLSLGGHHPTPPAAQLNAIEYALARKAIVVVAAGNEDDDAAHSSPANIPGVIVVSAVDRQGRKAGFSNTVEKLKWPIAAPGVDIMSLGPGHQYVPMSGTSMATPMVAGLLGVMRSLKPDLTARAAYEILRETGMPGPDAARCGQTIDVAAALAAVLR